VRPKPVLSLLGLSLLAAALLPSGAQAAKACGSEPVAGNARARVAVVGSNCAKGLKVAADVYRQIADSQPSLQVHFRSGGYRCAAVLAETELSCKRYSSWIFASTQPTDHPSEWHVPRQSHRHAHPYWRHCTPVPAVTSSDMLTHHVSCKRRKVIKRALTKSQTAQSAHV
jgi:hypothetical protein